MGEFVSKAALGSRILAVMDLRAQRLEKNWSSAQRAQSQADKNVRLADDALLDTHNRTRQERSDLLAHIMAQSGSVRILDTYQKQTGLLQQQVHSAKSKLDDAVQKQAQACAVTKQAKQALRSGLIRQEKWKAWFQQTGESS